MTRIIPYEILLVVGIGLFVAFAAYFAKRKRRIENQRLAAGHGPTERRSLA